MNRDDYVVLYADKKPEDNIIITNMFKNTLQINLGWTEFDYNSNVKKIDKSIKKNKSIQIVFSGFEIGWDRLVLYIKNKYVKTKIKVICNTNDSLLYYEYERNNFFKMLELSKNALIDEIAFLRKGQYETYKSLGYKCSWLLENYILDEKKKTSIKEANDIIDIGIYPLNYTWDKNIFNQLCIPKFVENSNLNYNSLDSRMDDFVNTMKIANRVDKIEKINEDDVISAVLKNDVVVATSFTEYVHPVFFICMELGIPCLIGNNSDMLSGTELEKYIVSKAEDNAIINSKMIKVILDNKDTIKSLYRDWKNGYNIKSDKSITDFLNK